MPESIIIRVPDGGAVTGLIYPALKEAVQVTVILGHGAGAPQTSRFMVDFADGLAARECNAATFNFPYMEHGRKVPDRAEKLEACCRAVIETFAAHPRLADTSLIIAGKSMGGRIASQVASAGIRGVKGLVFLGYPLHPPGRPDRLRAEHLARIGLPMLFVQGSRDGFGSPDQLRPIIEPLLPRPELYVVQEGDHSFKVPRGGPLAQAQVYGLVLDHVSRWSIETGAAGSASPSL